MKRHGLLALLVLTLGVLVSPGAQAQDSKPVIDRILDASGYRTSKTPVGGVIIIEGRNFHKCPEPKRDESGRIVERCKHPDLSITLDGEPVKVWGCSWTRLTVQVPPRTKPGRRKRIVVKIGRYSAKASIDVVSQKEWQNSAEGKREALGEVGGGKRVAAEEMVLKSFAITKFLPVSGGTGHTFVVEGRAQGIPDNLRVQIALMYNTRTIRKRAVPIKNGKFNVTFGPYAQQLLVGHYSVELMFSMARQSKIVLRRWLRELQKRAGTDKKMFEELKRLYTKIVRRAFANVGGRGPNGAVRPEDTAKQQKDLQEHTTKLVEKCDELLTRAKWVYASACRCFWKKAGSRHFDETQWVEWLKKNGFAETDEEIEKLRADTEFANAYGGFRSQNFAKWAKDDFLPKLKKVFDDHVKFNKRYICPIDERAERLGHFLITNVLKLFQTWANVLYQKSAYDIPQELVYPPFQAKSAPRVSFKFYDAKKKELFLQCKLNADGSPKN